MSAEEYIWVTKSRKKRNYSEETTQDLNKIIRQLEEIKAELSISEFFQKAQKQVYEVIENRVIHEIICLGIGKISEDIIAKYQLIFILLLSENLSEIQKNIKFFDPVFSDIDKNILNYFKFEVLSENKEGKYTVEKSTLFYLPHCPKQITNNLLFSNWSAEGLKHLIIICNSFTTIIESTPERILRPNAHYLLEIRDYTKELQFENSFRFTDIFNDLSIHSFPSLSTKLSDQSSDFWASKVEPSYLLEDIEFVRKNSDGSC